MVAILALALAAPPMIRGDTPPMIVELPPIIVIDNDHHPKPMPSPKRTRQEWYDVPGVGRRLITIEVTDETPEPRAPSPGVVSVDLSLRPAQSVVYDILPVQGVVCRT
jgi:hypothetical protein